MYTWKGRVVYNRKHHPFTWKDVSRILKNMRATETLKEFVEDTIDSMIVSVENFERDYAFAFEFSIKEFWKAVKTGVWLDKDELEQLLWEDKQLRFQGRAIRYEDYFGPQSATDEQKKKIKLGGADLVGKMLNLIDIIEKDVEELDASS
jgi:hypothetical protein